MNCSKGLESDRALAECRLLQPVLQGKGVSACFGPVFRRDVGNYGILYGLEKETGTCKVKSFLQNH